MTTSLAEQLRKLAAPQTSLLLQDKKRASLLFDPKEAANYDRQTIYELGIGGLEELKTLNARFGEFEGTIFDLSSQSLERAVQSKEVNKKLDSNIRKFFYLLSPYFLLKPSHKALEWLINRFHIHQYNVDDLLMLALPYHESRVFVRVVQLLDLSDESGKWHWLKPLQKPGIPLAKNTLLNHASSSVGFLKLLCETTLGAVKEHGPYAGVLSTLLAFYCTTLLGVLERSKRGASEVQMTHILEALQRGLASPVLDFAAASYMVVGRLVTTTSLSTHVLHQLINRITKMHHADLQAERGMLLALIYQSQHRNLTDVPARALTRLASRADTATTLGHLAASGMHITPFLAPLLKEALRVVQTPTLSSHSEMRLFVENIIGEIRLDERSAEVVIRTVIESYDTNLMEKVQDELMIVEDEISSDEVTSWYAGILHKLERSYPTVFDAAVCHAIKGSGVTPTRASSLRRMLGFELQLDLFDKLHHPKSKIRAEALRCLAGQCETLKSKDDATLRDSLREVLKDDSPQVVAAALAFPSRTLERILGGAHLHEALVNILQLHQPGDVVYKKWTGVVHSAIPTLCALKEGDHLQSLLVILPHMLNDYESARLVLTSQLAAHNAFLKTLKSDLKGGNLESVHSTFCLCIDKQSGTLDHTFLVQIAHSLLEQDKNFVAKHVKVFLTMLLLGESLPKNSSADVGLEILKTATKLIKSFELSASSISCELSSNTLRLCLEQCQKNILPLEGLLTVVQSIMRCIKMPQAPGKGSWLNLEEKTPETALLIQMYCLLSAGSSSARKTSQAAYIAHLRIFFETNFPSLEQQLSFLANLWTSHVIVKNEELTIEIQLRSLRIAAVLLKNNIKKIDWALSLTGNNILVPALLVALRCPAAMVRVAALEVVKILSTVKADKQSYAPLLSQLCTRIEELRLDQQQLQLVLYTLLSPDPVVRSLLSPEIGTAMPATVQALIGVVQDNSTPTYVTASILNSLVSVNSKTLLMQLLPLVSRMLGSSKETKVLDVHRSSVLCNLVSRINTETVDCFSMPETWKAFNNLLEDHRTGVLTDDKLTCPAVLACEQITRELWEALPEPQATSQKRLLGMLILTGTEAESPAVVSAVTHCVKQLTIDASLVLPELQKMRNASGAPTCDRARRRSVSTAPSLTILETKEWRCGVTLLELLQNKKKLSSVQLLLPVLFDLLRKCLDFEEPAPVEYAKQLVLSCILHCCQKLSPSGSPVPTEILPAQVLNVEAIVQSIRATQNPQTHHHALLLLAHMAAMVPEQVLHNIMAIFTFMGSLVLRQDDAYSFQVISKIVDTIIPILIKASRLGTLPGHRASELEETVASVMRVFVDAILDIPEHRRLSLFHKLLSTLDAQQYLWLFLCLVLESHIAHSVETSSEGRKSRTAGAEAEAPKRLEVAMQIVTKFPPDIVLTNCIRVMHYVRALPMEKDDKDKRFNKHGALPAHLLKYRVNTLFSVEHHSPKQLRHYKFTIITFLSALLSSLPFVNQISLLSEEATSALEPLYQEMMESVLDFVQITSRQADVSAGTPTAKYWRVMVAQTCDILDKVNALLPNNLFLTVVAGLMGHKLPTLRRKAMELLNGRLSSSQRESFVQSCDSEDLLSLLKPLLAVVETIQPEMRSDDAMDSDKVDKQNDEQLLNQQTALLSIKYLAKYLAFDNHSRFKPILDYVTVLLQSGTLSNSNLLASVVLCAAELCSALRAHAIATLPALMPALVKLLAGHCGNDTPDVVQVSLAAATQRVVESLAAFLSPYLQPLLVEVCALSARCTRDEEQGKVANVAQKLKITRHKLATSIPQRVLVPAVESAYKQLVEKNEFAAVGPLMGILSDSFSGLSATDLTAVQPILTDFFLCALQFRSSCRNNKKILASNIDEVEGHVVKSLVALVLKMSESSFRPLYYKLFEWATRLEEHKERTITFYRLSCGVAECLKGLFVLFAGHFLKNASMLLDHCNASKVGEIDGDEPAGMESQKNRPKELYFGAGAEAESKCCTLIFYILKTLHCVFLYDSQNFVSKERFETLMQSIVDQIENPLGGPDALQNRSSEALTPCVAQLAAACTDDTLWKQLNYQILLKTRHHLPSIRLVALEAVCSVARKLGEGFLPLLPETVPFLAELLEDEEEAVETACRRAVQDLEQVLGEPIQKYF